MLLPESCIGNDVRDVWLWCLFSLPGVARALPPLCLSTFSVSTPKLISVIKPYSEVMVSFCCITIRKFSRQCFFIFLFHSVIRNLAADIGAAMISYLADRNWKSSAETPELSAAVSCGHTSAKKPRDMGVKHFAHKHAHTYRICPSYFGSLTFSAQFCLGTRPFPKELSTTWW